MLGEFQSDRIESEFVIYQQCGGGNYFIVVDQGLNGLHLQKLKLFKTSSSLRVGFLRATIFAFKSL